jgi:ATP-binding cassette, subfamily C, bacterial LapB
MQEFFRRLKRNPTVTFYLIVTSVLSNFLALGIIFYTMNLMRRYVPFGVEATLRTLLAGVAMVLILEFVFKTFRDKLARAISAEPDAIVTDALYEALNGASVSDLDKLSEPAKRGVMTSLTTLQQSYDPTMIASIIDFPFSLLFISVLFILNPPVGVYVSILAVIAIIIGLINMKRIEGPNAELPIATSWGSANINSSIQNADSIRAFNVSGHLMKKWRLHRYQLQVVNNKLIGIRGFENIIMGTLPLITIAGVMTIAARSIVNDEMSFGGLLGVGMLASRTIGPIMRISNLGQAMARASEARAYINEVLRLPQESKKGTRLVNFQGRVAFHDLAFSFPGSSGPLFETTNLRIEPGQMLIVTGGNGTGKTTLARLLLGLIHPVRGQILVDGIDLRQVEQEWWRRNVMYMPQEPKFLDETLAVNIKVNKPDLPDDVLEQIIDRSNLRVFVDNSQQGLNTPLVNQGAYLSVGIRRRISLARALATRARITIFDEPTEGLDQAGRIAVYELLTKLSGEGSTMIIFSNDPVINQAPGWYLNLDVKPIPKIIRKEPKQPVAKPETVPNDESSSQ